MHHDKTSGIFQIFYLWIENKEFVGIRYPHFTYEKWDPQSSGELNDELSLLCLTPRARVLHLFPLSAGQWLEQCFQNVSLVPSLCCSVSLPYAISICVLHPFFKSITKNYSFTMLKQNSILFLKKEKKSWTWALLQHRRLWEACFLVVVFSMWLLV